MVVILPPAAGTSPLSSSNDTSPGAALLEPRQGDGYPDPSCTADASRRLSVVLGPNRDGKGRSNGRPDRSRRHASGAGALPPSFGEGQHGRRVAGARLARQGVDLPVRVEPAGDRVALPAKVDRPHHGVVAELRGHDHGEHAPVPPGVKGRRLRPVELGGRQSVVLADGDIDDLPQVAVEVAEGEAVAAVGVRVPAFIDRG